MMLIYYKRQHHNAVKALELIEGEREAQEQERIRKSLLELVALRKRRKQFQPLFIRFRLGSLIIACIGIALQKSIPNLLEGRLMGI